MKRNCRRFVIALGLAFLRHLSFDATAKVEVVESNGNTLSDYSKDRTIAFEIDWINTHPVTVKVIINKLFLRRLLEINIAARNNSKSGWKGFHIEIVGNHVWKEIHSAYAWDGTYHKLHYLSNDPNPVYQHLSRRTATVGFKPAVPSPGGLILGRIGPGAGAGQDWIIDSQWLKPFEAFTLRLWPSPAR